MEYKDIFFDLDHTLWDYDTSAKQTLFELYDRYELSVAGAPEKQILLEAFLTINDDLWDQFNKGEISKYFLRTQRFSMVFDQIGVNQKLFPQDQISQFNHDYLHECPQKPNLIDGALELLDKLEGNHNLHIITNGFNASLQHSIMIGDNLSTDIKGARDFGLDQVYFNPSKIHHNEDVLHEVHALHEILNIVS